VRIAPPNAASHQCGQESFLPSVVEALKSEGTLHRRCCLRPVQYLNNILEQDHRAIKRTVRASQGFRSFRGAYRTIQGYEAVHAIRKGQARWVGTGQIVRQLHFIAKLFQDYNLMKSVGFVNLLCCNFYVATLPFRRPWIFQRRTIRPVHARFRLPELGIHAGAADRIWRII